MIRGSGSAKRTHHWFRQRLTTSDPPRGNGRGGLIGDLALAVGLAVVLLGVYVFDLSRTPSEEKHVTIVETPEPIAEPPPPEPTADELAAALPPPPPPPSLPPPPRPAVEEITESGSIKLSMTADYRFGLVSLEGNPDDPNDDGKRLTFSHDGATNNTRLMVDRRTPSFGGLEGQTIENTGVQSDSRSNVIWKYRDIRVRQDLKVVAGDISGRGDTLRVRYSLENIGTTTHEVGLRVMLDTLIGNNDGVPFMLPGRKGIVHHALKLKGHDVPDFVRSLERARLDSPGVIVNIGLVPLEDEERPEELVLSHWPGGDAAWRYGLDNLNGDSAVGLYYETKPLKPGETRDWVSPTAWARSRARRPRMRA